MKDEIDITGCNTHDDIKSIINDWVDYYNNERYQWGLAKLSPNEYYDYVMTGEYPLSIKAPRFSVVPSSRVADSEQLKKYSSEEAHSN